MKSHRSQTEGKKGCAAQARKQKYKKKNDEDR